jgi:hypothetical protein
MRLLLLLRLAAQVTTTAATTTTARRKTRLATLPVMHTGLLLLLPLLPVRVPVLKLSLRGLRVSPWPLGPLPKVPPEPTEGL